MKRDELTAQKIDQNTLDIINEKYIAFYNTRN